MRMPRRKKGQQEATVSAAPLQAQFQSRPFQDANFAPSDQQAASPEMQLQQEQRGFDFASIPLFADSGASSQPIQRSEEDNSDIQMKAEPNAIQDMGNDDQEIQTKPESNRAINPLFKNLVQRDNPQETAARILIQAQLTVGAPGDKYEQEADQVAHAVVQQINSPTADATQPSATVQRETVEEDDDKLQAKSIIQRQELDSGVEASNELESSINQAKGGGQPLNESLQRSMGQAMGANFSGVKIHTDSQADTLNQSIQAKAFTTGQDVFFKQGEYNPSSRGGQELIAHELTHVVQQTGSAGAIQRTKESVEQQITNGRTWAELCAFAESRYESQHTQFLQAMSAMRKIADMREQMRVAKEIYKRFIPPGVPKEVNLVAYQRQAIMDHYDPAHDDISPSMIGQLEVADEEITSRVRMNTLRLFNAT